MALTKNNPNEAAPLAELKADTLAHLDAIKGELDEASKDADALEEIGLPVSKLRERIQWGYKAREVILRRYGRTP